MPDKKKPKKKKEMKVVLGLQNVSSLREYTLYKNRVVVLHGEINEIECSETAKKLMALGVESNKPIKVILNSVGGEVYHGLLVFDTIKDLVKRGIDVTVEARGLAACYDEETELLTEKGFKYFKDVTFRDKIATLNKDGYLEYHYPDNIFEYDYKGELIHYQGRFHDLLVTPNHRILVKRQSYKAPYWKDWEIRKAGKTLFSRLKFKRNLKWRGEERDYFELPPIKKTRNLIIKDKLKIEDFLEFLGYYLSEGSLNRSSYRIHISNKNKDFLKKCKNVIERMGYNPQESHYSDYGINFHSKQLYFYLKKFGKAKNKFIPIQIKRLSPRLLKILFNTLMMGDGSKRGREFYTSSKQLVDDVQEIALKIGYSVTVTKRNKNKNLFIKEKRIINSGERFVLGLSKKCHEPETKHPPSKVKYRGKVYCVQVPNHLVYIRRNGKSIWSGNSMGAVILQAGSKRLASRYTRFLIHEVSSIAFGKASEVEEQSKELQKVNLMLKEILAERTGKTPKEIEKVWHKRDFWMSSKEALDFGLIDGIV